MTLTVLASPLRSWTARSGLIQLATQPTADKTRQQCFPTRRMKNFRRALRIALAHRVNLSACLLTSFVIALLWGGNLTAVFPVVDVIMNDQSLPQWIDQKIAESDREVNEDDRWLAQLEKLRSKDAAAAKQQIEAEILHRQAELAKPVLHRPKVWLGLKGSGAPRLLPRYWCVGGPANGKLTDPPSRSGVPEAIAWQQKLDFSETRGGVSLTIDRSVSVLPDPSAP